MSFYPNKFDCEVNHLEEELFEKSKTKIQKVLKAASETVYYKKIINNISVDNITYKDFRTIPMTDKRMLNQNMLDMLSNKYSNFDRTLYNELTYRQKKEYLATFELELRITSGSTGNPVEIIKSKKDNERDYIMLNRYRRKLTDYNFKGNFVWIWPVNPLIRQYSYSNTEDQLRWRVNKYGEQYMLYGYSEDNLRALYDYIISHQIEWITSSPTALIFLIEFMQKYKYHIDTIQYIECHSEYLYEWQRKMIYEFFKCQIVSVYSSNEVQFIGGSCEEGHMHLFDKACFMEFIDNPYGSKDVYVTSLNYFDLPIIRYKLGDCGNWLMNESCNRLEKQPKFELKMYRENDYIVGKDGKRYEPFIITDSIVFLKNSYHLEINQYRVHQVAINRFEYYFEEQVVVNNMEECITFLQYYLSEILGYPITVQIINKDIRDFTFNGTKMKYFQVNKDIQ